MDKSNLQQDGYQLLGDSFPEGEISKLCEEAERISSITGSTCVRNLTSHSKAFAELASSQTLRNLIPPNYRLVRSILFNKTPGKNWPVAWHQDLTIAVAGKIEIEGYGPWSVKDGTTHVQPPTTLLNQMITARIHLDETPASNGALSVIPKSHLLGKIPSGEVSRYSDRPQVTCECSPGDILLMSPLILHASSRSKSPANRRILHFEFAPETALDPRLSWKDE